MTSADVPILLVSIGVLEIAAYAIYARAILRREVVPSRASWLIWAPLLWLTTASTLDAGAGYVAIKTVTTALGCTLIAILAIRYGTGGWSRSDRVCLALAAIGVTSWALLLDPVIGLAWFILADAVGAVPTIRDVARDPSRERPWYWLICGGTSVLAMLLVDPDRWELTRAGAAEWAYVAYQLAINVAVLVVLSCESVRRPALQLLRSAR